MVKFHGLVLFSLSHKSQRIFLNKTMFTFNHTYGFPEPRVMRIHKIRGSGDENVLRLNEAL